MFYDISEAEKFINFINNNDLCRVAYNIAKSAHKGKVDKAGNPYVEHLLSVAYKAYRRTESDIILSASLLHDVIEDTDYRISKMIDSLKKVDDIKTGSIIYIVNELTRSKDEKYNEYIKRVSLSKSATIIKICDLEDNCDLTRFKDHPEKVEEVTDLIKSRYLPALTFLTKYDPSLTSLKEIKQGGD